MGFELRSRLHSFIVSTRELMDTLMRYTFHVGAIPWYVLLLQLVDFDNQSVSSDQSHVDRELDHSA